MMETIGQNSRKFCVRKIFIIVFEITFFSTMLSYIITKYFTNISTNIVLNQTQKRSIATYPTVFTKNAYKNYLCWMYLPYLCIS